MRGRKKDTCQLATLAARGALLLALTPPLGEPFHDIKPLPHFSPIPWEWLALPLLGVVLYRLLRRRKKSVPTPVLPPDIEAETTLQALEHRLPSLTPNELGEALALCLRTFYQRGVGVQSQERTFDEVQGGVIDAILCRLPLVPKERREAECRTVQTVLRTIERLEFANQEVTPLRGRGAEHIALVRTHIATLAEWIKKEGSRTESVTESSPQNFPLCRGGER